MSEKLTNDSMDEEPIDYEAAVNECIRKIDENLSQIHESQAKTARLREETWAILKRIQAFQEASFSES